MLPSHHEHAVGPPVGALRVAPPVHHLRSHVLHRPTEGVGFVLVVYGLLTETEVWTHTSDRSNLIFQREEVRTKMVGSSLKEQQENAHGVTSTSDRNTKKKRKSVSLHTGQLDVSLLVQQDAETTEASSVHSLWSVTFMVSQNHRDKQEVEKALALARFSRLFYIQPEQTLLSMKIWENWTSSGQIRVLVR